MRLLTCFTTFALVSLLAAAPTSSDEEDNDDEVKYTAAHDIVNMDDEVKYTAKHDIGNMDDEVKYTAKHDIVNMVVPLNSINFDKSKFDDSDTIIFFVEADVQPDGSRVDQGLYVLKDGKATKLLDNGRDAAASIDDSKKAFFGAKDGLYVYNLKTNSAEKYGTITDSIISIDMEKFGEVIYILTEDREVYKVTENGEKKEKLEDVVKPKQIVVDFADNLFFLSDDQVPYVRTADGVKKIEGLPEAKGSATLYTPPMSLLNGAPIIIANEVYVMFPNGTSKSTNVRFQPKALPTALAAQVALVEYYACDKKIYIRSPNYSPLIVTLVL